MRERGATAHIVEIVEVVGIPGIQVRVGVVADGMAAVQYLMEYIGVLAHIVAYAEKGSLGVVVFQLFEHPGRHFRHGAVVEGEIKNGFFAGHFPGKGRKVLLDELGSLDQIHSVLILSLFTGKKKTD